MTKYKVTFYPDNKTVEVEKDRTILSAAISAGVFINSACGGDGVCGRCKVILKKGNVFTEGSNCLSIEEKSKNIYLACITLVQSDLEVEIPAESRVVFDSLSSGELKSRLTGSDDVVFCEGICDKALKQNDALAQKVYLELTQPNLEDAVSDLDRIYRQVHKNKNLNIAYTNLSNIRSLGKLLRDCDWKVTVSLDRKIDGSWEMFLLEPLNTANKSYGIAFDIGTTTVSAQLIDLESQKVLGTKATYNKQAVFGADVITRIVFAAKKEGLEKLHAAVIESMNSLIADFVKEQNIDLNNVICVLCSGNTTMIHLLLSIDPTYIRKEPYVPTANFIASMRVAETGININPKGLLYCVPGVSSYVGGDVTAGVLACDMDKSDDINILIDIGTNGEVALGNKEFMIATSASAGPAFEGSGVTCGMRSSKGAIQKVNIDAKTFELTFETIGDAKARGICGSGYIDILAQMLEIGLMEKDGKIKDVKSRRVRKGELGKEYVIAFKEETDSSTDIVINEADIDNLKRAKAAIYAAVCSLLRHVSLDFNSIKKIFIAGGFGTSLNIKNSIKIGLLPKLDESKFIFVGNSSLSGSREMILSFDAFSKACEIARKMTYLELSAESSYMDEYMAALFFPHTNVEKFK